MISPDYPDAVWHAEALDIELTVFNIVCGRFVRGGQTLFITITVTQLLAAWKRRAVERYPVGWKVITSCELFC